MCDGLDSNLVSMPVFMKYIGLVTYPLPDNSISINFEYGRIETYIYIGDKDAINYIITHGLYYKSLR
jgi:hypothetical protein